MNKVTKESAIVRFQLLIDRINEFWLGATDDFNKWQRDTQIAINHIFGQSSHNSEEFGRIVTGFSFALRSDLGTFRMVLNDALTLLRSMVEEIEEFWGEESFTNPQTEIIQRTAKSCVFIGHGKSVLWAQLQIYLEKELGLETVSYESESRIGVSIVPVLNKMLNQASFAVLVLTAEDVAEGKKRARQNVIHEAGLFQGRLGFEKAILLRQEGIEDFSNVAGLQYIPFSDGKIEETFYELQRVLKREGLM